MTKQEIYQKLKQIKALFDEYFKELTIQSAVSAYRELEVLIAFLEADLQKQKAKKTEEEKENPQVGEFVKWYYGVWQGRPPEGKNLALVGKLVKKLLEEKGFSLEEVKSLYAWWKKLEKVPPQIERKYYYVLIGKEARDFKLFYKRINEVKALKSELESLSVSKEYATPKKFYEKAWKNKEL